jgi:predicted deacylase
MLICINTNEEFINYKNNVEYARATFRKQVIISINMNRLIKLVKWNRIKIPGRPAQSSIPLTIGSIGKGEPKATIIAGVHGDESPWSAWAIYKFLENVEANRLEGTIMILPHANPTAMEADSRVSPIDHLDLNRVFPGDPSGSHTQIIAHEISKQVLQNADIVIDLHGGGSWCVNAFAFRFTDSKNISLDFNPPFLVRSQTKGGSLSNFAKENGSTVAAIEMGGKCIHEMYWVNHISEGLERSLGNLGAIESRDIPMNYKTIEVSPTTVVRPSYGGIFVPSINENKVGKVLDKDTILGQVFNPLDMTNMETFKTPFKRTAVLLLRPRITILKGGEMTYVISDIPKK